MDWNQVLTHLAAAMAGAGVALLFFNLRSRRARTDREPAKKPTDASQSTSTQATAIAPLPEPAPPAKELTFGVSPEKPAVILRPIESEAYFGVARSVPQPEPVIGRLNAMVQAVPGLLVAEQHAGKHLMEVVINGDLIRAADGVGFRAMARGATGITEHARLLDPANLSTVVNAAAVWQVASVLVAQKHLADISAKLKSIEAGIERLSSFLNNERRSRLTGAYSYLQQLYLALRDGRLPLQAAVELESAERDLLGIFDHLMMEFHQELDRPAPADDTFGTESLTKGIAGKLGKLESLSSDLQMCLQVRTAAWYILAVLPDVHGLREARRSSIEQARVQVSKIAGNVVTSTENEATRIKAFWNKEETLRNRRQQVLSAARDLQLFIENQSETAASEFAAMLLALEDSGKPMKLLLAVENNTVTDTRLVE